VKTSDNKDQVESKQFIDWLKEEVSKIPETLKTFYDKLDNEKKQNYELLDPFLKGMDREIVIAQNDKFGKLTFDCLNRKCNIKSKFIERDKEDISEKLENILGLGESKNYAYSGINDNNRYDNECFIIEEQNINPNPNQNLSITLNERLLLSVILSGLHLKLGENINNDENGELKKEVKTFKNHVQYSYIPLYEAKNLYDQYHAIKGLEKKIIEQNGIKQEGEIEGTKNKIVEQESSGQLKLQEKQDQKKQDQEKQDRVLYLIHLFNINNNDLAREYILNVISEEVFGPNDVQKFTDHTKQQDSSEFLGKILDIIDYKSADIKVSFIAQNGNQHSHPEKNTIVPLPIDKKNLTIQGSINKFQEVQGYLKHTISSDEENIIISLNRFENQNNKPSKIETKVEDVDKIQINKGGVNNDVNEYYYLQSFVLHRGRSATSGHYIYYSKVGEKYFEFNDALVKEINKNQFLTEAENGYLFNYKKTQDVEQNVEIENEIRKRGIGNHGATCYRNAAFQMLSDIKEIREKSKEVYDKIDKTDKTDEFYQNMNLIFNESHVFYNSSKDGKIYDDTKKQDDSAEEESKILHEFVLNHLPSFNLANENEYIKIEWSEILKNIKEIKQETIEKIIKQETGNSSIIDYLAKQKNKQVEEYKNIQKKYKENLKNLQRQPRNEDLYNSQESFGGQGGKLGSESEPEQQPELESELEPEPKSEPKSELESEQKQQTEKNLGDRKGANNKAVKEQQKQELEQQENPELKKEKEKEQNVKRRENPVNYVNLIEPSVSVYPNDQKRIRDFKITILANSATKDNDVINSDFVKDSADLFKQLELIKDIAFFNDSYVSDVVKSFLDEFEKFKSEYEKALKTNSAHSIDEAKHNLKNLLSHKLKKSKEVIDLIEQLKKLESSDVELSWNSALSKEDRYSHSPRSLLRKKFRKLIKTANELLTGKNNFPGSDFKKYLPDQKYKDLFDQCKDRSRFEKGIAQIERSWNNKEENDASDEGFKLKKLLQKEVNLQIVDNKSQVDNFLMGLKNEISHEIENSDNLTEKRILIGANDKMEEFLKQLESSQENLKKGLEKDVNDIISKFQKSFATNLKAQSKRSNKVLGVGISGYGLINNPDAIAKFSGSFSNFFDGSSNQKMGSHISNLLNDESFGPILQALGFPVGLIFENVLDNILLLREITGSLYYIVSNPITSPFLKIGFSVVLSSPLFQFCFIAYSFLDILVDYIEKSFDRDGEIQKRREEIQNKIEEANRNRKANEVKNINKVVDLIIGNQLERYQYITNIVSFQEMIYNLILLGDMNNLEKFCNKIIIMEKGVENRSLFEELKKLYPELTRSPKEEVVNSKENMEKLNKVLYQKQIEPLEKMSEIANYYHGSAEKLIDKIISCYKTNDPKKGLLESFEVKPSYKGSSRGYNILNYLESKLPISAGADSVDDQKSVDKVRDHFHQLFKSNPSLLSKMISSFVGNKDFLDIKPDSEEYKKTVNLGKRIIEYDNLKEGISKFNFDSTNSKINIKEVYKEAIEGKLDQKMNQAKDFYKKLLVRDANNSLSYLSNIKKETPSRLVSNPSGAPINNEINNNNTIIRV
jgi:hypothetical protein